MKRIIFILLKNFIDAPTPRATVAILCDAKETTKG